MYALVCSVTVQVPPQNIPTYTVKLSVYGGALEVEEGSRDTPPPYPSRLPRRSRRSLSDIRLTFFRTSTRFYSLLVGHTVSISWVALPATEQGENLHLPLALPVVSLLRLADLDGLKCIEP